MTVLRDPDFMLSVGGQDVSRSVTDWELSVNDDKLCSLGFTLENQESQWAGKVKIDEEVAFKFGYKDEMSPIIKMTIRVRETQYDIGQKVLRLTAYDKTERLNGGNMQGCFKEGCKTNEAISSLLESNGMKPNVKLLSPKWEEGFRFPMINLTAAQGIYTLMQLSKETGEHQYIKQQSVYGPDLKVPSLFKGVGFNGTPQVPTLGQSRLDTRDWEKDQKIGEIQDKLQQSIEDAHKRNIVDGNRANNVQQKQQENKVTATLELLGYPSLRVNKSLTIENVDESSGDWYIKSFTHKWSPSSGFKSSVHLMRGDLSKQEKSKGGSKKGKANAPNTMIMHAEIFDGDSVYCGPREGDAESIATLVYGDGNYVISFKAKEDGKSTKDGAESSNQKTKLRDTRAGTRNAGIESQLHTAKNEREQNTW